MLETAVAVLSVYVSYRLVRTMLAILEAIFVYLIAPFFYTPPLHKYRARWTVVTGGTDGIGKAYAYELVRRGLRKFILIGRSAHKLADVQAYLELQHGCDVKTVLFDFATDEMARLRPTLDSHDVGLVVHSVGVGRENLERFGDFPEADMQILRVNGMASAEFLAAIIPTMEQHGGGQIVVLSSSQSFRPIPGIATYCAAKSVMSFLAECIDRERATIRVQCLTPSLVATNMTFYKTGSLFVVMPDVFARAAVGTLGLVRVTSGCFNHEIQMLLRHLLPWSLLKYALMPIYAAHRRRLEKLHAAEERARTDAEEVTVKKRANA